MRKPKLAITCNVGWVYRNVFLTGIISELEKHFCILVLCNEITRPLVKAALRDSSAECLVVDVSQNYLAAKLRSLLSAILVMRDSPRYGAYRYSPSNLGIFLLKYLSILVPECRLSKSRELLPHLACKRSLNFKGSPFVSVVLSFLLSHAPLHIHTAPFP